VVALVRVGIMVGVSWNMGYGCMFDSVFGIGCRCKGEIGECIEKKGRKTPSVCFADISPAGRGGGGREDATVC